MFLGASLSPGTIGQDSGQAYETPTTSHKQQLYSHPAFGAMARNVPYVRTHLWIPAHMVVPYLARPRGHAASTVADPPHLLRMLRIHRMETLLTMRRYRRIWRYEKPVAWKERSSRQHFVLGGTLKASRASSRGHRGAAHSRAWRFWYCGSFACQHRSGHAASRPFVIAWRRC